MEKINASEIKDFAQLCQALAQLEGKDQPAGEHCPNTRTHEPFIRPDVPGALPHFTHPVQYR